VAYLLTKGYWDMLSGSALYTERSSRQNQGAGAYTDITCYMEDGTPGLRLWFTIETY